MSNGFRLGLFYTIVRPEERALLEAATRQGVRIDRLHDEGQTFDLDPPSDRSDVVLNRSISHSRALYAARFYDHYGIPTVNEPAVVEVSGDKVLASIRLKARGIPTPRTIVALTADAALRALDLVGVPGGAEAPDRVVGALDGQSGEPSGGGAGARAQERACVAATLHLLHSRVRPEARARHPGLGGGRTCCGGDVPGTRTIGERTRLGAGGPRLSSPRRSFAT